jgi:hypothetical protein
MRVNWANFEGQHGFGITAAGVLDRNLFGNGETLAIGGGFGWGEGGNVGGRLGMQLTWK